MEFLWPYVFILLPIPLLVRYFMTPVPVSVGGALRIPFYQQILTQSSHNKGNGVRKSWRMIVLSMIWVLLVTALARPVFGGREIPLPVEGRDLMMAIDLSGSMGREDFTLDGKPSNRLTVVKAVADDFIERRDGDRLGLVLFSERAYLQAPLTFDRTVVRDLLNDAQVGLTGQKTAIGDAIAIAVKRLKDRPIESRVLILLTDGANNAGVMQPLQAAEIAKSMGIRIYTIGVGADAMAVSSIFGQQMVNPSEDLDEATLSEIAVLTGGRYFRAKDVQNLAAIYAELDRLEPVSGDSVFVRPTVSLFFWPLSVALILTLLLSASIIAPSLQTRDTTSGAAI